MDPQQLASLMSQMNLSQQSSRAVVESSSRTPTPIPANRRRAPPQYHHGMSAEETTQHLKEYRDWFEEDRKIPPEPAPHLDRSALIAEQVRRRDELQEMARRERRSGVQVFTTMIGFPKHSSSTPVERLKSDRFANMLVRRAHVGHYLLCRIVAPCSRMVAIQTVVEDTDGIVHDLSIYNFPSTFVCSFEHIDVLFPVGGILAIREPTFKAPMQGDRPLVRVDSPTDVIFVGPNSGLLQNVTWRTGPTVPRAFAVPTTLDSWQQRGNAYFKASQWFLAAFAYSHGLAIDPDAAVLRLNRAEAYLRLKYFSGAVCDAQRVLSAGGIPDAHVGKAVFRLAKAQYGRGEYGAAEGSFVQWKSSHPEDQSADAWIDRCRARQKEQETGQYDWVSMVRTAKQKIRLDVADYVGPIEVSQMAQRGGGRGVVATKDVNAGDLLMVTKPFVSVYASDIPQDKIVLTLDLTSYTSRQRTDAVLLARLIEKLYGNPDSHDSVYHLYAGPDYPPPPATYPPVPSDPKPVEPLAPTVDIDIAQLEAICTYNNFCPFRLEDQHVEKEAPPTGLYPLASLFNHSCYANAIWYCIGDVMIVRAAEPIPAGTEITIPYSVEESYIDRQAALKKHMLEHCTCPLCEEDRNDGEERLQRRHKLKEQVGSRDWMSAPLAEVRAFEKAVRETFAPTRGPVRPLSALALHILAERLRASGSPRLLKEALQVDMQALRHFGFDVLPGPDADARGAGASGLPVGTDRFPTVTTFLEPVAMMLRIACTYLNLHDEPNAVRWMKGALWLTEVSVGGGKPLFMVIHEAMLEQMNIRDYAAQVL